MFSREPQASARGRPALARSSRLNERSWFSLERLEPVVEALFVLLYGFRGAHQLDVVNVHLAFEVDGQHPVIGTALRLVGGINGTGLEQVSALHIEVREIGIARLHFLDFGDVLDALASGRDELLLPTLN